MTAAATAVSCLGAREDLLSAFLAKLGEPGGHEHVRELWARMIDAHPYLDGPLHALTGWLDEPADHELSSLSNCLTALSRNDIHAVAEDPVISGDLLGPLYTLLRSHGDKQALGAFFTPASIARVIAEMSGTVEHSRVYEPACGSGAMVVAAARSMRARGMDPRTVTWVLNDIDPVVVALAGINAAASGLGQRVVLTVGDALAAPSIAS